MTEKQIQINYREYNSAEETAHHYWKLLDEAVKATESSYAPYSNFNVGAAVLMENGEIVTGSNQENAASPSGLCAERVALSKAISEGECEFLAISVVGGKQKITDFVYPCGACRQFLSELCPPQLEVVLFNGKETKITTLDSLLPSSFNKFNIK